MPWTSTNAMRLLLVVGKPPIRSTCSGTYFSEGEKNEKNKQDKTG
jgi:hypothetical protein